MLEALSGLAGRERSEALRAVEAEFDLLPDLAAGVPFYGAQPMAADAV